MREPGMKRRSLFDHEGESRPRQGKTPSRNKYVTPSDLLYTCYTRECLLENSYQHKHKAGSNSANGSATNWCTRFQTFKYVPVYNLHTWSSRFCRVAKASNDSRKSHTQQNIALDAKTILSLQLFILGLYLT